MRDAHRRFAGQRGRILDFSLDLFFRYGFSRVTIEEIVAELHISKTTFYKHFASKEDLLTEVIRSYYRIIRNGIASMTARGMEGYREELRNILLFVAEKLARMDSRARQDIRTSAPGIWKTLQALQRSVVHAGLEKALRKGMELGILRPDRDAGLVAELLVMSLESAASGEGLIGSDLSSPAACNALVDVYFEGLLAQGRGGRNPAPRPAARLT